jgi:50S ribosomal subunit-associated GTPase HflX
VGLGDRFLGHAERCASILHLIDGAGDSIAKTYKTIRAELIAYGHGLEDKTEIVALNKVDAIPKADLARKRAALEKACGHKVHLISGVSGEGISTVLRAMAREVNRRRLYRAEQAEFGRAAPVPRSRSERQAVNFKAPVVPKARLTAPQAVKTAAPATTVKTVTAKVMKPMAKAKAKATRKLGNAKVKKAAVKPKTKTPTGRAKAKPRPMSKTAQRTKKKQRR